MPSFLRGRIARKEPLPRLELTQIQQGPNEEGRRLQGVLAFVLGMEDGSGGKRMPRDVFRGVLMDLLMPPWDRLRKQEKKQEEE
jgi:hypothetical protein